MRAEREGERGVALLIVILTVALLTVSVMEFTYSTQVEYRRTAHWLKARKAETLAESGVMIARTLLEYEYNLKRALRGATGGEANDPVITGLTDMWARFCQDDGFPSCPSSKPTSCEIDTGDGGLALRIEDETGRFNLNRLARANQRGVRGPEFDMLDRLLLIGELDPTLAGPIVDWVDTSDATYAFGPGAESPEYYALDLPYGPRNRPFETLRELALVAGIGTEELGRLRRLVNTVDPEAENAKTFNINTAPVEVLRAFDGGSLEPFLNPILNERCREPFKSLDDLKERLEGLPASVNGSWIHFESTWFRVRATGHVDDVYQSAEAVVARTDVGFRLLYYLPRRGPNIGGVDMSESTGIDELARFSLESGGLK